MSYVRKVKEMKQWSDKVAGLGRERQKAFLEYCQKMIRENFIYNFQRHDELNYMNETEADFAVKFAPFINENNVFGIIDELSLAQRDIMQNTNPKMVFFDFALKMIVLIKNR
jgi:DNA polymerase-3 subunit delta'